VAFVAEKTPLATAEVRREIGQMMKDLKKKTVTLGRTAVIMESHGVMTTMVSTILSGLNTLTGGAMATVTQNVATAARALVSHIEPGPEGPVTEAVLQAVIQNVHREFLRMDPAATKAGSST
jgi:hypothetical protein